MKKRLFVVFLIFLILSSITYVEAREVKTLKDLFNSIKEIFITGKATSDSSPDQIGVDEKLPIKDGLSSREKVTCYFFHNSIGGVQRCYESSGLFECSGTSTCTTEVYGNYGEWLFWKSSCFNDGGYGYATTVIDGEDESVEFICERNNLPEIISFPSIPATIYAGQNVEFSWTAQDPDNDPLHWEIDWGDGQPSMLGSCSIPNCFTYSTSKTWNYPGYYNVLVRVDDPFGKYDYYKFRILVSSLNQTNTTINGPDLAVT